MAGKRGGGSTTGGSGATSPVRVSRPPKNRPNPNVSVTATSSGTATGGGGYSAPPVTGPVTPPVNPGGTDLGAGDPGNPGRGAETGSSTLDDLTEEQIGAAMAAIEAQYGMTREQLLSDKSMAGLAYQRLTSELSRARAAAGQVAEAGALQRGVLRSGIYANEQGNLAQQFAEQRAAAQAERQQRIAAINQSLAQLKAQQEAEKAAEAARIRREALAAEQTTTVV